MNLAAFKNIMTLMLGLAILSFFIAPVGQAQSKKKSKEMCITFDELPASRAFGEVDAEALNYLILQGLRNHQIKAAGFVVGSYVEGSFDILGQWLNEGHTLGNLTNSNQDYHQIDIKSFISDIAKGYDMLEPMLSGFGQKKQYFRFPYLHYGTKLKTKEAINIYLEDQNILTVHATIVVDDYLYNLSMEKLGKIPDSNSLKQLRYEYIEHIIFRIQDAELKSKQVLGRSCRQIMQFRANRINAVLLEEILTAIENLDYKFVSLERALEDELYSRAEAYYGARGVGFLDMILESDPDHLPAE